VLKIIFAQLQNELTFGWCVESYPQSSATTATCGESNDCIFNFFLLLLLIAINLNFLTKRIGYKISSNILFAVIFGLKRVSSCATLETNPSNWVGPHERQCCS
jgi:hypothetical protein